MLRKCKKGEIMGRKKRARERQTNSVSLSTILYSSLIHWLALFLLLIGRSMLWKKKKEAVTQPLSVALLIDGDNISSALSRHILLEAEKLGQVLKRRIYGKW